MFRRLIISSCFVWSDFLSRNDSLWSGATTLEDLGPPSRACWGSRVTPRGIKGPKWHQKGSPKDVWRSKVATIGSEGTILDLILIHFCDFLPAWLSIQLTVPNFETPWTHWVPESIKIQDFRDSFWRRSWSRVEQQKSMFRVDENSVFKVLGG